jgi:hypothetical protein
MLKEYLDQSCIAEQHRRHQGCCAFGVRQIGAYTAPEQTFDPAGVSALNRRKESIPGVIRLGRGGDDEECDER